MNILFKLSSLVTFRQAGVLLYTSTPEDDRYSYYRVHQKNGQANVETLVKEKSFENLEELSPFLGVDVPLLLSYQGEGLVQRIYTGQINEIAKHIPNIETKDYVIQHHETNEDRTFIALLRNERMEAFLTGLNNKKIFVTNVFLGFYGFIKIPDLFYQDGGKLVVGSHYLEIENKKAVIVGKSNAYVKGNQLEQSGTRDDETMAVATAITFFISQQSHEDLNFPVLENNNKELLAAKFNKLIFKYVVPFILGLLLINFIVLQNLRKNLQSTELTRYETNNLAMQVDHLKKEISSEKEFVVKANLGKSHVFAFYVDRLGALNISGIRFEEIEVDPVKNKIRADELIQIDRGLIVLRGTAKHAIDFGNLLVLLRKEQWIKKIEKQVYAFDKDLGSAKFEIVMSYKEPD